MNKINDQTLFYLLLNDKWCPMNFKRVKKNICAKFDKAY